LRSTRQLLPEVSFLSLIFLSLLLATPSARATQPTLADESTQMLVVTTSGWNDSRGTLQRYERTKIRSKWKAVGKAVSVVVGRNGLGWDAKILSTDSHLHFPSDPVKHEGDGKAPAGIFRLGTAFGYAPQPESGLKMPYLGITDSTQCVDDVNSKFYNRLVDHQAVSQPDWNSNEDMHRKDDLYQWGLIVEYNSDPPVPGRGSCIFMHIWKGPGIGTSGCTAMEEPNLESVLQWLDSGKIPVLVQMPEERYAKLRRRWRFPRLSHR